MAGSKSTTPAVEIVSDDEDLLGGIGGEVTEDDFDDLLNQVDEEDSEGWVPTEIGEGVTGRVTKVGETRSDFAKPGEDPMVPTITIDGHAVSASGERTEGKWRVIGYGAVLKREMEDAAPQVGDKVAVKYFGEKPVRKGPFAGKNYKHYGIAVRRAPAVTA